MTGDQPVFVNHVLDVSPHFLLGECFHFWLSFAFVSLRRDFDRGLNLEFHGSRTELEGITMDFKKFITDLAARYRTPTEPTAQRAVVDVDAVHEVGRKAGHEAGHAEGYEAGRKAGYEDGRTDWYQVGYNKGYDEGFQMGLEAKTPPEPEPPPPKSES